MSILGARELPQTKFRLANDFMSMKAWMCPTYPWETGKPVKATTVVISIIKYRKLQSTE